MTSFARYYRDQRLLDISMEKMEELIKCDSNKNEIAEHVYERLYCRFLKIFDFTCNKKEKYNKCGKEHTLNVFNEEFKNGFLQLAACSLLIETFAAFLTGENETPRNKASTHFKKVFEYAESKENALKIFKSGNEFYDRIRCGLLHQGETKGKYLISRKGNKLLEDVKIDAYLFHSHLKELLKSYKEDLIQLPWDVKLWYACKRKIWHIINNCK